MKPFTIDRNGAAEEELDVRCRQLPSAAIVSRPSLLLCQHLLGQADYCKIIALPGRVERLANLGGIVGCDASCSRAEHASHCHQTSSRRRHSEDSMLDHPGSHAQYPRPAPSPSVL